MELHVSTSDVQKKIALTMASVTSKLASASVYLTSLEMIVHTKIVQMAVLEMESVIGKQGHVSATEVGGFQTAQKRPVPMTALDVVSATGALVFAPAMDIVMGKVVRRNALESAASVAYAISTQASATVQNDTLGSCVKRKTVPMIVLAKATAI